MQFTKQDIVIICALIVIGLSTSLYIKYLKTAPQNKQINTVIKQPTTKQTITIHLAGAINNPGVYQVTKNSRLVDILPQANGLHHNANADQINLAQKLEDGKKINIPFQQKKNTKTTHISINTAAAKQLQTVKGIGPSMAQKIVTYRNKNGAFETVEALKKVKGIGPKTLKKLAPYIAL